MYTKKSAPFGDEESTVKFSVRVSSDGDSPSQSRPAGVLFSVLVDHTNKNEIDFKEDPVEGVSVNQNLICSNFSSVNKAELTIQYESSTITNSNQMVEQSLQVQHEGEQVAVLVYCSNMEDGVTNVKGTVTFKNPYGYLSGTSFAYLPFYASLAFLYIVLAITYLVLLLRHRHDLLWLQYVLFGVVTTGLVEVLVWFSMYLDLNFTGKALCCPLHSFATAAVVLNVFKRTVSRCLLVAVCLGFGVVRPKLSWRNTLSILILGVLYFGFSTNSDIRLNSSTTPQIDDISTMPVTIMDVVFVLWIFHGLTQVEIELTTLRQIAKLKMYITLKQALIVFTIGWIVFAIFSIMCDKKYIDLSWKMTWILHSFWHLSYFMILLVISVVWKPSEQSQQYAYSFQIPSSAAEAEAYEQVIETNTSMIEMTETKKGDVVVDDERHGGSKNGSGADDAWDDVVRNPFGYEEEENDVRV